MIILNCRRILVCVMLLAGLVLTCCSGNGSNRSAIVGKWQLTDIVANGKTNLATSDVISFQLQFFEKDTVSISINVSQTNTQSDYGDNGTYTFPDDNHIRIDMPSSNENKGLGFLKQFIATLTSGKVTKVGEPTPLPEAPISYDLNPTSAIYEFSISGSELSLKGIDGVIQKYKKID